MKINVRSVADIPTINNQTIPCVVSGTANALILTPDTEISSLSEGMKFSFTPNYTSDTSSTISAEIILESGSVTKDVKAPDGYTYALWYDLQKNKPTELTYAETQDVLVISSPALSFKQSIFSNGRVKLQANSATSLSLTQDDGQGLVMWNDDTDSLRIVATPTTTNSSLFTSANNVEGTPNQALSTNQLYAVHYHNTDPTNDQAVELRFWRMYNGSGEAWTPTINDLGMYMKRASIGSSSHDNSETYLGLLWTGSSDISTSFNGTTLRSAVQSHYNPWVFPMESSVVSVTSFTSGSTSLQSTPQAIIVTEGLQNLPFYEVFATYKNSTVGCTATLGLSISGKLFDGTTFTATSKLCEVCNPIANKPNAMYASWGVACPMGVYTVKPIITVDGGTASFDIHMKVHFAN